MRLGGVVVVRFRIRADGSVEAGSLVIIAPSGVDSLNVGALATVRDAAPFDPPPFPDMTVEAPLTFSIR